MKKKALVLVTIVAIVSMMIGVQSALSAKPAPVNFMAKGQVISLTLGAFPGSGGPPAPVGPWKVVLNLNTCHVSFTATCQTAIGVVKVSSVGMGTYNVNPDGDKITITVNTMIAKNKGTSETYRDTDPPWLKPHTIVVDTTAGTVDVNIYSSPTINLTGSVSKFHWAP